MTFSFLIARCNNVMGLECPKTSLKDIFFSPTGFEPACRRQGF
jgi:hypothetical protein